MVALLLLLLAACGTAPTAEPVPPPPGPELSVTLLERAADAAGSAGDDCTAIAAALAPVMDETADQRRAGAFPERSAEEMAAFQAEFGPRIAAASQRLAATLQRCQDDPDIRKVLLIATE